ncbi:hypothetical protein [Microviridae sp.]|nr:hypothetical protein [Microviridae sp.]
MLASTGANILAGAFGGSSNDSGGVNYNMNRELNQRRDFREQQRPWERDDANWGLQNIYGKQIQTKVADAKAAGLHPLFAMGASGYSPAATNQPSPSPPGQSQTGSFAKDALLAAGQGFQTYALLNAQKDLTEAQTEASKVATVDNQISNDTAPGVVLSKVPYEQALKSKKLAEYKPAEIGSHEANNPTASGNVKSLTTGIRVGNQVIQVPVEDAADLADNPSMLGVAYFDKANRHVDWAKAARDFTGMSHPRPFKNIHDRGGDVRVTKKFLWNMVKFHKYYQRTRGQGR